MGRSHTAVNGKVQNDQTSWLGGLATKASSFFMLYLWLAVTLTAAISGPFGTFTQFDFTTRLAYWALIAAVSILVPKPIQSIVRDRFSERPKWQVELVLIVIITPILTAAIWTITPRVLGVDPSEIPSPMVLAGFVLVIAIVVIALQRVWDRVVPPAVGVSPAKLAEPRLFLRLSEEMRGEVYRLTGRDHLVEVVTSGGTQTVRMRFADAIAEIEPVQGHCSHRSHWVARAAIKEVERDSGKVFLRLANGDRIPVSRKYRPDLEEAGIV